MRNNIIALDTNGTLKNWEEAINFYSHWHSEKNTFEITTSGSTGSPKTISISRKQMIESARLTIDVLQLSAHDKLLVGLNTQFIGGKMMLVRGFVGEMLMYITEPSANPLKNSTISFDFTAVVPMQLETMLLDNEADKLNAMKAIIVGGAPISQSLQAKIEQLKVPVYATYGMTETVSHIALKKLNGSDKSSFYSVLGDTTITTDERNCLIVEGKVTNNVPIITNDVVELLEKGQFKWLGRYDNIINSGGVKINPEQIEETISALLSKLAIHRRFFIHGVDDNFLGKKVVLYIEGKKLNTSKLVTGFSSLLEKYHQPKDIVFIEYFESTLTGKINRLATLKKL